MQRSARKRMTDKKMMDTVNNLIYNRGMAHGRRMAKKIIRTRESMKLNQKRGPMMKYNCGAVGFTNDTGGIKYLLVKKKYTYVFINLLLGRYQVKKSGITLDLSLISNMERILLIRFPMKLIYLEYFTGGNKKGVELQRFAKYTANKWNMFRKWTNGQWLNGKERTGNNYEQYLMSMILSPQLMWEIPKGLKNKNETKYECARREFLEETGYRCKILKRIIPKIEKSYYGGKTHITNYYLAKICDANIDNANIDNEVTDRVTDEQEIDITSWFCIEEINIMPMELAKKKIIQEFHKMINKNHIW